MKRIVMMSISLAILFVVASGCDSDNDTITGDLEQGTDDSEQPAEVTLVGPIERSGVYVLEMTDGSDTVLFECKAEEGGLITKFRLNGEEMLSTLTGANAYGSTFWPSPQSDWDWPPPSAIGADAYTVSVESDTNTIVLTSGVDTDLGVQVVKRFSPDLENMAVELSYTIVNTGETARSFAPWEITRVEPGGLTFFALGSEIFDIGSMQPLPIAQVDGLVWFDNPVESEMSGNYKLFADGAGGWLAHVQNNMMFIKAFADETSDARAPDEAEIEIYAKGGAYVEVEQQGAYQSVPSGGERSWTVKWFLRALPDGATQSVGDTPLAEFAASFGEG